MAAVAAVVAATGCGYVAIGGAVIAQTLLKSNNNQAALPEPVFVRSPATVQTDVVPITYNLTSSAGTKFDVTAEYSTNGIAGPFLPATEALGSPSEGTKSLNASPAGTPHVFVWNSFFDLDPKAITHSSNVVFRVTALTTGTTTQFGKQGFTNTFTVDNRLFATILGSAISDNDGIANLTVALRGPTAAIANPTGILVADTGGARVRSGDGTSNLMTTFAGTPTAGFRGDGGPATTGRLLQPKGLALTPDLNLVIVDQGNSRLRFVDVAGRIQTIAGNGSVGFSGDGGPATSAKLNQPTGVAIDSVGTIYFTDTGNNVVRSISTGGTITTIAGTGVAGTAGDGGTATGAQLNQPTGICVDPKTGAIYVADTANHAIRQILNGKMTTVVGQLGTSGIGAEKTTLANALLNSPLGVCLQNDALVVADSGNNRIRRGTLGGTITTIAGALDGTPGFAGDNGAASFALLNNPALIAADGQGGILIPDSGNNRVRQINAAGTINTVMGSGAVPRGVGDGSPATQAIFVFPFQVFRHTDGTFFVIDQQDRRVRSYKLGGTISTVIGTGVAGTPSHDVASPAETSLLNAPRGVCVDDAGVVFVCNSTSNNIVAVNPIKNTAIVVAGDGTGPDGIALTTSFNLPRAAIPLPPVPGKQKAILITDQSANRIRRLQYNYDATTGNITNAVTDTICGTGAAGFGGTGGNARNATLRAPQGLVRDNNGNIIFADTNNHAIRVFPMPDPNGNPGNITTIAGNGTAGFSGDGGPATSAKLFAPSDVAFDTVSGTVYIADQTNNRIRAVDPSGIITTIAGDGSTNDSTANGPVPATSASINFPQGCVFDPSDRSLHIAATGLHRILKLDIATGILSTAAGIGPGGSVGDGGPGSGAALQFNGFVGVAPDGTVFNTDQTSFRCRRLDARTRIVTTFAGTGVLGANGIPGPASGAQLIQPRGVQIDNFGNVYINNRGANQITRVDPSGQIVTIAGTGVPATTGTGGPALAASINDPQTIALSPDQQFLYFAETAGSIIRRIDLNAQTIDRVVAGNGSTVVSTAENVPATTTSTVRPTGLVVAPDNQTLYYSENTVHRIRKFTVGGNLVTVAGVAGQAGFNGDGIQGQQALINSPFGSPAVDAVGNVYFGDTLNSRVRRVDVNGFITTVVNTSGIVGIGPNGSVPGAGQCINPCDIVIDGNGNIYVGDFGARAVFRFRQFP